MNVQIAEQMLQNRVNVMFGGGREYFIPKPAKEKQFAQKDLIAKAIADGYEYAENAEKLQRVEGPYVLGLFQLGPLSTKNPELSLPVLTDKAIELLNGSYKEDSNENEGFFLMVEGSQIDWACHANKADEMVRLTLLFDLAVKKAVDFALEDGKTLVVVTADHETGGLAINNGRTDGTKLKIAWTSKGHTASFVPVFAFGPGAELFAGVYDNTDIPKKFAKLLGIKDFPQKNE